MDFKEHQMLPCYRCKKVMVKHPLRLKYYHLCRKCQQAERAENMKGWPIASKEDYIEAAKLIDCELKP